MALRTRGRIVGRPVVRAASRVGPLDELLAVARDAHRHDLDFARTLAGEGGNVEVVKLRLRSLLGDNLLDDAAGDLSRPLEVGVLVVFQRAGDTGDAEE